MTRSIDWWSSGNSGFPVKAHSGYFQDDPELCKTRETGRCVCLFIRYHSAGWNARAKKGKLSVFRASRYTRSRNLRKIIQRARVRYLLARCPLSAPSFHVLNLCSVLKFLHPPLPPSGRCLPICLAHETTGPLLLLVCQGPQLAVDVVAAVVIIPFQTYKSFFSLSSTILFATA